MIEAEGLGHARDRLPGAGAVLGRRAEPAVGRQGGGQGKQADRDPRDERRTGLPDSRR